MTVFISCKKFEPEPELTEFKLTILHTKLKIAEDALFTNPAKALEKLLA